jgi:hypothetical protein
MVVVLIFDPYLRLVSSASKLSQPFRINFSISTYVDNDKYILDGYADINPKTIEASGEMTVGTQSIKISPFSFMLKDNRLYFKNKVNFLVFKDWYYFDLPKNNEKFNVKDYFNLEYRGRTTYNDEFSFQNITRNINGTQFKSIKGTIHIDTTRNFINNIQVIIDGAKFTGFDKEINSYIDLNLTEASSFSVYIPQDAKDAKSIITTLSNLKEIKDFFNQKD